MQPLANIIETLQAEFNAEPHSFLYQLRVNLYWDKIAFKRLTTTMYRVANALQDEENIPKWIAEGFWYCDTFIKSWTSHANFPKPNSDANNSTDDDYLAESLEKLNHLAWLLFTGDSGLSDEDFASDSSYWYDVCPRCDGQGRLMIMKYSNYDELFLSCDECLQSYATVDYLQRGDGFLLTNKSAYHLADELDIDRMDWIDFKRYK